MNSPPPLNENLKSLFKKNSVFKLGVSEKYVDILKTWAEV